MKLYIAALVTLTLLINSTTLFAHLGVEHPTGEHDYFPDFSISPLNDQIYFQNVLNVVGSRDIEEIPDGSGRFLSIRGINQVKLTAPGRVFERKYVITGRGEARVNGQARGAFR